MHNTILANRYARSLITLAEEREVVDTVLTDMKYLSEVCKQSRDFILMLKSPIIKRGKKVSLVEAILKGQISPLTFSFIELLIKKGREFFLPEMTEAYINQYKVLKNIHEIKLTTALPIDEDLYQSIKGKLGTLFDKGTIDLQIGTDEELIGGFVLEAGDKVFDASISKNLKQIKRQFAKNPSLADF